MKSKILDYVDFEKANTLLEGFNKATGFVTALLDLDGNILSKSGWRQICTDFHRKNPEMASNCIVSDTELANKMRAGEKHHFYKCINGLIDVGVPIVIRGEHIANLFSGQFFFAEPNTSFFKKQAKIYGFEENSYLEALREVPVISKENVEVVMNFLQNITQLIIEMTAEKLDQIDLNEAIKKSEAALQESQVQLKQNMNDLLESQRIAHLGTWRLNLATNQVVWSAELYKMYGFDPTLPLPSYTEHMKLFTPESWDKLSTSIEHTTTVGIPYELELETANKDRPNGWMWTRGEAETDSKGNISAIWGAAQDISERKRAEAALQESENRLIAAQKMAHVGNWELNLDTNSIWASEESFNIYGIEQISQYLSLDIVQNIVLPEYRNLLDHKLRGLIAQSEKYNAEFEIIKANTGKKIFVHSIAILQTDGNGKPYKVVGTIQDITDRKKAEESLLYTNYHDYLTGLYNRRLFEEKKNLLDIEEMLPLSIIISDINGLKLINDGLGHAQGDNLIIETAKIIQSCCRKKGILARTGGDEFSILLPKTDKRTAAEILNNIQTACSNYNKSLANETFYINISLGYGTKGKSDENFEQVSKLAEDAMYQRKLLEHKSSHSAIISSIKATMIEKSNETEEHAERLVFLSRIVGSELGLSQSQLDNLELYATLHDIGKVGISNHILKKPGTLSQDEWVEMKKHSIIGYRIAMSTPELVPIAEYILSHHERWDGKGYPQGLSGVNIPLPSRILAVVDAYDAMTGDRCYRKAMPAEDAIEEIKGNAGTQFDPDISKIFVERIYNKIKNNNTNKIESF